MTEIEYYEILKKSLPEETAKATVNYINDRNGSTLTVERAKKLFATKENLARFATKEDLVRVKVGLRVEIHAVKVETLRWLLAFILGQTAVIFALIKLFVAN